MHKNKTIYDTTASRYVYNRSRKEFLEKNGEIYCSRCPYHRVENITKKRYYGNSREGIRHPSWKLVSKNRKQWMKKPITIEEKEELFYRNIPSYGYAIFYNITWKRSKYTD